MRLAILSVLLVIFMQDAALAACIYSEWCYCRGAASAAHVRVLERSGETASAEVLAVAGGSPGVSVGERITIDTQRLGSAIFAVVLFFGPVQRVVADGDHETDGGATEVDPAVLPITGSGNVYCETQPDFVTSPTEVLRVSVLETQACIQELAEAGFTPAECNDTDGSGPSLGGCRAARGGGGLGVLALLLFAAVTRARVRQPRRLLEAARGALLRPEPRSAPGGAGQGARRLP